MKIRVNTVWHIWDKNTISYDEAVQLAKPARKSSLYTITISYKKLKGRTITPGQTAEVEEGSNIEVHVTDSA